jgi:hypothetical protein
MSNQRDPRDPTKPEKPMDAPKQPEKAPAPGFDESPDKPQDTRHPHQQDPRR